ncbi:MAG TPA: protein kinase [Gemmatimonadaceae bacterium]|nr:protein kinase [Gemmatimonadaceae bacterium]
MDAISKLRTSLAARYEIEREIGAGGMATVYLAKDQRHDRNVALKVLNPELGAVLGVERFLSEIKVTANLQHPNLLPLFDSGEADGLLFYVMPFVEGETLRHKLDREKQLPIDEAIRIAVAVANALDYAHSHNVIHRDLKPENILLQHGQPVVADFGIALAVSKAGGNRVTQTGLSLGTPQYMSPEQATGDRVIDGRTDIYSLGALTYEMLSGEPPHIGHTSQAIIARLLTDKPRSVRASRPAVPEHVDWAVQRALEKLPADRFSTAKEFADALQGRGGVTAGTQGTAAAAPAVRRAGARERLRDPVTLTLSAITVAAVAAAGMLAARRDRAEALSPIRFVLAAPDSLKPIDHYPWPAAISPDGRVVVYSVGQRGSGSMFYALRTDQLEARPIPGTNGAFQPYFAPDGQWLAFQSSAGERKMRLDGSAPVTISVGGSANGADWTVNDEIILGATLSFSGLARVSAAGGEPVEFTHPDTSKREWQHVWPIAVPDGKHVVFTIWYGALAASQLAVASIEDGRTHALGIRGIRPLAVLDGKLVYVQADGTVMAVGLDAPNGRIVGRPIPVHDPVPVMAGNNGNSGIYVSRGGMVTARGNVQTQLTWLSLDGGRRVILPEPRSFADPSLSPDERRVAVLVTEDRRTDVWIYDFTTSTFSRLTSIGSVLSVVWSPDGAHVVYAARGDSARSAFWRQSASGGSAAEKLIELPELAPVATISPDSRWLVYQVYHNNSWDLNKADLTARPAASTAYVATAANELPPRFSRDGKWVAFLTDESGRNEVYVRSFPDPVARVQVSAEGALEPTWSDDGSKLYYRSGNSLLVASVEFTPTFRVVRRDTLIVDAQLPTTITFGVSYDMARDGRRILSLAPSRDDFQLVISPNWITEFRARIAASEGGNRR